MKTIAAEGNKKNPSHLQLEFVDMKHSGDTEFDGERNEDEWCRVRLKFQVLVQTRFCVLL